jgi:hypothetical protein
VAKEAGAINAAIDEAHHTAARACHANTLASAERSGEAIRRCPAPTPPSAIEPDSVCC